MQEIHMLCTIGPSSRRREVIEDLAALGATHFRINMSHTRLEDLVEFIEDLQKWSTVPICIDSEGAQVRTAVGTNCNLSSDSSVEFVEQMQSSEQIALTPAGIVSRLERDDVVHLDFGGAVVQIREQRNGCARGVVISGGVVSGCKGVEIENDLAKFLPAITSKDRAAIKLALTKGIRHFALSFASEPTDVREMRDLIGQSSILISKIETRRALSSLEEIASLSDAVLVDRGDLSRQIPIAKIPVAQRLVCEVANRVGVPAYIATNLVETMINSSLPTRAEANDIYSSLANGATGLVLAAETAIGHNPVASLKFVSDVASAWKLAESRGLQEALK